METSKKIRPSKYPSSEISDTFSEQMQTHPSNYSEVTCKNYNLMVRMLLSIIPVETIPELLDQLLEADITLSLIKESPQTDSNKENIVKAIPCIYKVLAGVEMTEQQKAPYIKVIVANNNHYLRQVTLKKAHERLPLFTDFLEQVKGAFGEDSKEYLLISLYSELTCRDDFSQLLLTPTYKQSICKFNYLVVRRNDPCEAILNQYKTSKKYGPIRVTFSQDVSNRIKRYINNHDLQYGDYLFSNKKLSGFVSGILSTCGLCGSISTLRKMMVSEFYNSPDHSEEEYEELAKRMGHSTQVASSIYHRGSVQVCMV